MQPIDQISTGVEYSLAPNNISGARYLLEINSFSKTIKFQFHDLMSE